MDNARGLTYGIAIGAGLMFLFDPRGGGARRAIVRQKSARAAREVEAAVGIGARDLSHRAHGVAARVMGRPAKAVSPEKLVARVRTKLGRVCSHPHAVAVNWKGDGAIELKGPVLEAEKHRVVSAISRVPGVREIDDDLEAHPRADIAALQGGVIRPDPLNQLFPPATRLLIGIGAAGLAVLSLVRGRPVGLVAGVSAVFAVAHSIAHRGTPRLAASRRGARRMQRETRSTTTESAPAV